MIYILSIIIIILCVLFLLFVYPKSVEIHPVVAGDVGVDHDELDKYFLNRWDGGFVVEGKLINPNKYFIGDAKGNSMWPKGIKDQDRFFSDESFDSINKGDIFVIRSPDNKYNPGILKLREIVKSEDGEEIITQSYDDLGKPKATSHHLKKNLVARVLYVAKK